MDTHTTDDADRKINDTLGLFNNIVDFLGESLNKHNGALLPVSQADAETHDFADPDLMKTAYAQSDLLVRLAIDQGIAFFKTLTEPICTFASWTCVRAVLESSALAAWLLDPRIDSRTRLARCLAYRHEGLKQQVSFWRAARDEVKADAVDTRIVETEKIALGVGFPALTGSTGKRNGIAMAMPSSTEVVHQMLNQEPNYRLLSAVVHGHSWALLNLGTKADVETTQRSIHLSPDATISLCIMMITALTQPIWYMCHLHGWEEARLASILDAGYDNIGIMNEEYRYWR